MFDWIHVWVCHSTTIGWKLIFFGLNVSKGRMIEFTKEYCHIFAHKLRYIPANWKVGNPSLPFPWKLDHAHPMPTFSRKIEKKNQMSSKMCSLDPGLGINMVFFYFFEQTLPKKILLKHTKAAWFFKVDHICFDDLITIKTELLVHIAKCAK